MKRPDINTPHGLFEASARYKAPVFQRPYVWGRAEIEALAEDIETADPQIGQFLGAIVLKDMGRPSGPSSPTSYLMIDGQQRLTTLYMILLALANIAANRGDRASADFIWQNYLVEVKSPQFKGWPKLVPTLQDRHTFWDVLTTALPASDWDFSADPEEKKPREARKLRNQWKRLVEYAEQACVDATDALVRQNFDALLRTIQEYLQVICIVLEQSDDANAIFSRLNAQGVPLELADLVRNEVFSKFGPAESTKAERFFARSWQPFEKQFSEGDLSAFFPVYAYIALKGKVTKAAAFAELQKRWKAQTPQTVLTDLSKYSPYFVALSSYTPIKSLSRDVNAQVERFSRMPRSRVTWPFIIEVLRAVGEKRLSEPTALDTLAMVESFLVRRALVGWEPTGLHAVFKALWEKTKGDPSQVLTKIVTRTIQTPDDAELTETLRKERSDSRVILRFILEEYEHDFVKANKYDPPPADAVTIEHILPQHLTASWQSDFSVAEHEKHVGLIGNLVALSEKQNKSLKDQGWSEKRKRFRGSNFKTTQQLASLTKWTGSEIAQRTEKIIDWILSRWTNLDGS